MIRLNYIRISISMWDVVCVFLNTSSYFIVASDGGLSEGYGHDGPGVCLGDSQTEAEGVPSQSGGVLSEGYGHGGPGVCLGDGQTEADVVPLQGGRGDALLRRMPPYLT